MTKVVRYAIPAGFLLTGLALCFFARKAPVGDFGNYYFGSSLTLQEVPAREICEPCAFNKRVRTEPGMDEESFYLNYAPVPPFSLAFYMPFTFLPWPEAKMLFNVLTLLLFSVSLYRLLRMQAVLPAWALLLPLVFFLPLKSNVFAGQSYLLIAALLIEAYLAKEKPLRASFFLALAAALKLFPLVLLLFFFVRRQTRTIVYTLGIFSLLAVAGSIFAGWESTLRYYTDVLPRFLQNEINDPYAVNYQSVYVFLKTLLVGDGLLNPSPLLHAPLVFEIVYALFSASVLVLAWYGMARSKHSLPAFSMAILLGFAVSAYSSIYSLLLLVLPAMALTQMHARRLFMLAVLTVVCFLPVHFLELVPMPFRFGRALFFLLFFFLFLPHEAFAFRRQWLAGLLLLFVGARLLLRPAPDESKYYLDQEAALLICDYRKDGNRLVLDVMGEQGMREIQLPCAETISYDPDLLVNDNRVMYKGQALITGTDNKKHPAFFGARDVLYLSDRNRGVGFYTLRIVPWRHP